MAWFSQESQGVLVEKTYDFIVNLANADIITKKAEDVTTTVFTINQNRREILFEHPNSQVIFKDLRVHDDAELEFGIGLNERAWDKEGDGFLFEIDLIDEKGNSVKGKFNRTERTFVVAP